jgi:hypothetical protein
MNRRIRHPLKVVDLYPEGYSSILLNMVPLPSVADPIRKDRYYFSGSLSVPRVSRIRIHKLLS